MSLTGTLNIGQSPLPVAQPQLQTTLNNIPNAGNCDYTHQPAPGPAAPPRVFPGPRLALRRIHRHTDGPPQAPPRTPAGAPAAATADQQWLGRIESVFNALGDNTLATQLSAFFNSWSALANKP